MDATGIHVVGMSGRIDATYQIPIEFSQTCREESLALVLSHVSRHADIDMVESKYNSKPLTTVPK